MKIYENKREMGDRGVIAKKKKRWRGLDLSTDERVCVSWASCGSWGLKTEGLAKAQSARGEGRGGDRVN